MTCVFSISHAPALLMLNFKNWNGDNFQIFIRIVANVLIRKRFVCMDVEELTRMKFNMLAGLNLFI